MSPIQSGSDNTSNATTGSPSDQMTEKEKNDILDTLSQYYYGHMTQIEITK